jgi:hypothetical protein
MKNTIKNLINKAIKNSSAIKGGNNDDLIKNLGGASCLKSMVGI